MDALRRDSEGRRRLLDPEAVTQHELDRGGAQIGLFLGDLAQPERVRRSGETSSIFSDGERHVQARHVLRRDSPFSDQGRVRRLFLPAARVGARDGEPHQRVPLAARTRGQGPTCLPKVGESGLDRVLRVLGVRSASHEPPESGGTNQVREPPERLSSRRLLFANDEGQFLGEPVFGGGGFHELMVRRSDAMRKRSRADV